MLSFPVYLYIYIYIYWYQSDTHGIVVAPRPFNGMMRQTVWPVCGFADRQRRPWSQSDWLGVRTRRAQGPPEVAHHRPTFSTSGLALSLGPPRPLSLSLSPFEDFERFIFRLAQVSLTGHERTWKLPGDGTTGWRFFSRHKSGYLHEFELGITSTLPGSKKIVTCVLLYVSLFILFFWRKGGGKVDGKGRKGSLFKSMI